ncbi:hypothetical protein ACP70R_033474 [Stipagrostis hirtigluma subsp. patula]
MSSGGAIHLAMFPWLGFGHIVPFAQLARTLVSGDAGIRVTFLTAAGNVARVEAMLASAAGAMAASTAELSADGAELLKVAVDGTRPQLSALLAGLRPDAVLIDFANPWVCDVAARLGIRTLYFNVVSAAAFAYITVPARRLHGRPRPSADDLTVAPAGLRARLRAGLPGGGPHVRLHQLPRHAVRLRPRSRRAPTSTTSPPSSTSPCSSQGRPVVPEPPQGGELEEPWASWLASFPENAVVFASFGSETFLPAAAAAELLLGLEAAGRPFIAVINFPKCADAEAELAARIPPGLEERVKGRGLVRTGSMVEALVAGCRLVLLPIKTDQFFNAALFARELHVGVEVARRDEDGWFTREDVREAIAAATAAGGEGNARRWREFFTDDAMHKAYAHEFVRELKELVSA